MKSFDALDPSTPLKGHTVLEASAGTGKTFAIEHLAVRLLLENIPLSEILIVTFTRAATRELKSRLRLAISNALNDSSLPYMKNLQDPGRARLQLEEALTLIDGAQIFTIHGFCHRMLSEFAFEAKLGFDLPSEDAVTYRDLLRRGITDFFHTSLSPTSYSTAQLASVLKNDPKKLIGKILTLIEKDSQIPSYPTFQESFNAFKEAQKICPKITLEDYHAIAPYFNGLRPSIFLEQIEHLTEPMTEKHFDAFLYHKNHVLDFLHEENRNKRKKEPLPPQVAPFFELRKHLLPIIEMAKNPLHTLCRIAYDARDQVKTLLNLEQQLSPDDILKSMHRCLQLPEFKERVQKRYQAAIIDEFQDTDPLQWDIFKTLFIDDPIATLYLVGDPKQSIYSFRNADIHAYLGATELIPNKAHLNTNYRSEPQLIQHLNALFSLNPNWLSYTDTTLNCPPVETPVSKENTQFKDGKSPLHFFIYKKEKTREKTWPSPEMETSVFFPYIATEIGRLVEGDVDYKEIAILVKDRYQGARLQSYLASQNIPAFSKGLGLLTDTTLYDFFYDLIEAVKSPTHSGTVLRFLAHPLLPYNHHDLKKADVITEAKAAFAHFAYLFEAYGFERMLSALLHTYWQGDQALESLIMRQGSIEALSDFQRFSELLLEFVGVKKPTLGDLLDYLQSLKSKDEEHPFLKRRALTDSNVVTLMTIHMSKGLEFPIVFALGLMKRHTARAELLHHRDQWLPFDPGDDKTRRAIENLDGEKLRQLYVAMTRAKKRLYVPLLVDLSNAPLPYGSASPLELFFDKLPPIPEVLEKVGATSTELQEEQLEPPSPPMVPSIPEPEELSLSFPTRALYSFSSLASPSKHTTPVVSEDTLPKGAETGILLHNLMESLIREGLTHPYSSSAVRAHVKSALQPTNLEPWTQRVIDMVDSVFHTPLAGFALKDIPQTDLHTEVEFLYSASPNYIKGFADLIFRHKDHYYIVDWKTNLLEDYTPEFLNAAMEEHDYFLQAKIYQEALARYLKQKQARESVGGAFYIFLRGLAQKQGVLFLDNSQ